MGDLNTLSLPALFAELNRTGLADRIVRLALDEDLGRAGDVTSAVTIPESVSAEAAIVCRGGGTIAGLEIIPLILNALADHGVQGGLIFTPGVRDGGVVPAGAVLGTLRGRLRAILTAERTVLNFLGRLSGVATRTGAFVGAMGGPGGAGTGRAGLYDTRKTTPGLRILEKYAVRCGGGLCYRVGLYDAVLIKDNHIAGVAVGELAGVVLAAAERARAMPGGAGFVEVEVDTPEQLRVILEARDARGRCPADIILLDNMTVEQLGAAVALRNRLSRATELEASGGVTLETIGAVARTGVDRVSVGGLTHQATWLDVALDIGASPASAGGARV
jgi:nicotinate-nucleotide pyrophosphorylase (carboxylating)